MLLPPAAAPPAVLPPAAAAEVLVVLLLVLRRLSGVVRLAVLTLPVVLLGLKVHEARSEIAAKQSFEARMRRVMVKAPDGEPPITQESIDLALVLYGIDVPASAKHPLLDLELKDRGLTSRMAFASQADVTVGPAAFSSWSLLGSTLAHELEIHCKQNFLFITLMDGVGFNGTAEAERQAYIHELRGAKRFGLVTEDADLIAETMEYYYPEGPGAGPMPKIKRWMARNLLRDNSRF